MSNIWPSRIVRLTYGKDYLPDEIIRQIIGIVGKIDMLDKPVIVDGAVRQIILVLLGDNGIGSGSLLLQVTDEREYSQGPLIRFTVIPHKQIAGSDRPRLLPGAVGDTLDKIVKQLRATLGSIVAPTDDDEE